MGILSFLGKSAGSGAMIMRKTGLSSMAFGGVVGGLAGAVEGDYNTWTGRLRSAAGGAVVGAAAGGILGNVVPRIGKRVYAKTLKEGRKAFKMSPELSASVGYQEGWRKAGVTGASAYMNTANEFIVGAGVRLKSDMKGLWNMGSDQVGSLANMALSMTKYPGATAAGLGLAYLGGRYAPSYYGGGDMAGSGAISRMGEQMQDVSGNIDYGEQAQAAALMNENSFAPILNSGAAPQMIGRMSQSLIDSTMGLTQGLHRGRHG